MPKLVTKCLLCKKEEFHQFDQRIFRGKEVINQVFEHCGLVFQSPRMSKEELSEFYQKKYRSMYQGSKGPTKKDLQTQKKRANSFVAFFDKHASAPTRHLDIGSSAGILLKKFQRQYECTVMGVEPGDAYRVYAQENGLEVYSSLNEIAVVERERFDLISMAHVLEHITNPVAYLRKLRKRYLHPKGNLLIEVPNVYEHDSFEIAHLVSFCKRTLRETLKKAGFEVTAIKTHGQPRSELLLLYILVLAQPSRKISTHYQVRPEKRVALKRRTGMLKRRLVQKAFPHKAWLPLDNGSEESIA